MGNGPSQLVNSRDARRTARANTLYDCYSAASRGVIKINNVSAETYKSTSIRQAISQRTSLARISPQARGCPAMLTCFKRKIGLLRKILKVPHYSNFQVFFFSHPGLQWSRRARLIIQTALEKQHIRPSVVSLLQKPSVLAPC